VNLGKMNCEDGYQVLGVIPIWSLCGILRIAAPRGIQ